MLLKNKVAVIYGGGGSLGGTVAKAFAGHGAEVIITGRSMASLQKVVDEIRVQDKNIGAAVVDALDPQQVKTHLDAVLKKLQKVDIVFNAIGVQATQNMPLTEMSPEDFFRPISIAMRTQFITGTAAARAMILQRSGLILSLTATPGGIGYPFTGGFAPACTAMETFSQNLGSEVGKYGVRTANMRSAGSPDSRDFREAIRSGGEEVKKILGEMANDTMLKQLPLMNDIANVAVFLASDMAAKITGVTVDVTAGTTAALNYKSKIMPFK
jgi:3-oxoacyl-[acyl-carrier protein] reductase